MSVPRPAAAIYAALAFTSLEPGPEPVGLCVEASFEAARLPSTVDAFVSHFGDLSSCFESDVEGFFEPYPSAYHPLPFRMNVPPALI